MLSDLYIQSVKMRTPLPERGGYVFRLPVVKHLSQMEELPLKSKVTFFVGENGTGKSTLLEAIAISGGFNAEGGTRNFNFSTYRSFSELHQYIQLIRGVKRPKDGYFLRAESFYNAASYIDELDSQPSFAPKLKHSYGGKSLHDQSHGESFLSLVLNRFGSDGLYLLDEPEAALSPARQFSLLSRMHDLVKQNSQFIIATHSPILLAYPDAEIYVLSDDGIVRTPYEQTEPYILTKQFLNNPQKMLHYILDDGDPS